jgi:hypothetical protein
LNVANLVASGDMPGEGDCVERGRPYVRLVLTLELRRALAERLSEQAIRSGKNLEAVVIEMLEAGAKR